MQQAHAELPPLLLLLLLHHQQVTSRLCCVYQQQQAHPHAHDPMTKTHQGSPALPQQAQTSSSYPCLAAADHRQHHQQRYVQLPQQQVTIQIRPLVLLLCCLTRVLQGCVYCCHCCCCW